MAVEFRMPSHSPSNNRLTFRWDKGDIFSYYELTRDILSSVQVPIHLLLECSSKFDSDYIIAMINQYYDNIVHALYSTPHLCIPQKYHVFYKYWWDEELTLLKESAIDSFKLWTALGKPRSGCLLYTSPSPRDRQKSRMPSSA